MLLRSLKSAPFLALLPGLMLPGIMLAQVPKVPEKVDKALRARVNEFFQYHVDGAFRKAIDLVADDTKDEYFASGKTQLKSFKLDDIKYSDKFDKATVTTTVQREWEIRMHKNLVTIPMVTSWRMEHGKWVWYHNRKDEWLTPMGPSNYSAIKPNPDGSVTMPKINQDTANAAAVSILNKPGVDKLGVHFTLGKAGSDKITFGNPYEGPVQLELIPSQPVPGLTVKLDKFNVNKGETATVDIRYEPQQDKTPPPEVVVRFTVIPFNLTYEASVFFEPEKTE